MSAPSRPPAEPVPLAARRSGAEARRNMLPPSRERRVFSQGQLARRRFLLRWVKRLLPVAALAVLGVAVLWPEIERADGVVRVTIRQGMQAGPEAVRVVEPRYQGLDEQNRPYNLTAATASQAGTATILDLERPRADMLLTGGAWVLLESNAGRFDRARNHLDLAGAVTLWHDNGTVLVTEAASVELREVSASGDRPVAAQGPFGTLTSEGFRLRDRGQVVIFTGQSRLVLEGGS